MRRDCVSTCWQDAAEKKDVTDIDVILVYFSSADSNLCIQFHSVTFTYLMSHHFFSDIFADATLSQTLHPSVKENRASDWKHLMWLCFLLLVVIVDASVAQTSCVIVTKTIIGDIHCFWRRCRWIVNAVRTCNWWWCSTLNFVFCCSSI